MLSIKVLKWIWAWVCLDWVLHFLLSELVLSYKQTVMSDVFPLKGQSRDLLVSFAQILFKLLVKMRNDPLRLVARIQIPEIGHL